MPTLPARHQEVTNLTAVMPGLVPGIHVFTAPRKGVDGRDGPAMTWKGGAERCRTHAVSGSPTSPPSCPGLSGRARAYSGSARKAWMAGTKPSQKGGEGGVEHQNPHYPFNAHGGILPFVQIALLLDPSSPRTAGHRPPPQSSEQSAIIAPGLGVQTYLEGVRSTIITSSGSPTAAAT